MKKSIEGTIEQPKMKKETIIKAEDKEGKEIEFNLEETRQYWIDFYKQHNLKKIQEELEQTEINLTPEQIEQIKEKAEQGFDRFILLPSIETQEQQLENIKEQTEKKMEGLIKDKTQYKKTRLCDAVKPNFPAHIQTNNRPKNKSYLLFIKDNPEVDDDTRDKKPKDLREMFKQKQETGLTLSEYLIFQRDYTQKHIKDQNPHPDTQYLTWLLDSELDQQSSEPGRVLRGRWAPNGSQVRVYSLPGDLSDSRHGAHSSVVFELNQDKEK